MPRQKLAHITQLHCLPSGPAQCHFSSRQCTVSLMEGTWCPRAIFVQKFHMPTRSYYYQSQNHLRSRTICCKCRHGHERERSVCMAVLHVPVCADAEEPAGVRRALGGAGRRSAPGGPPETAHHRCRAKAGEVRPARKLKSTLR